MDSNGYWIETYTGRKVYPLSIQPVNVCIEDIAHSLSLTCRYSGHCCDFYSVAQHSILVWHMARRRAASGNTLLAALLHDAAEAYTGDIARPIKRYYKMLTETDKMVEGVVLRALGVKSGADWELIKHLDNVAIRVEAKNLMVNTEDWASLPECTFDDVDDFRLVEVLSMKGAETQYTDIYKSLLA